MDKSLALLALVLAVSTVSVRSQEMVMCPELGTIQYLEEVSTFDLQTPLICSGGMSQWRRSNTSCGPFEPYPSCNQTLCPVSVNEANERNFYYCCSEVVSQLTESTNKSCFHIKVRTLILSAEASVPVVSQFGQTVTVYVPMYAEPQPSIESLVVSLQHDNVTAIEALQRQFLYTSPTSPKLVVLFTFDIPRLIDTDQARITLQASFSSASNGSNQQFTDSFPVVPLWPRRGRSTTAPLNVRVSPDFLVSLIVTWDPPEFSQGVIDGYRISYSSPTLSVVKTFTDMGSPYFITGLQPITEYSVQVAAINDAEFGDVSLSVSGRTGYGVVPPVISVPGSVYNLGSQTNVTISASDSAYGPVGIYYICVARFNASTLNIPTESLGPFSDSSDLIYVALIRNMSSDPFHAVIGDGTVQLFDGDEYANPTFGANRFYYFFVRQISLLNESVFNDSSLVGPFLNPGPVDLVAVLIVTPVVFFIVLIVVAILLVICLIWVRKRSKRLILTANAEIATTDDRAYATSGFSRTTNKAYGVTAFTSVQNEAYGAASEQQAIGVGHDYENPDLVTDCDYENPETVRQCED